MIRNAIRQVLGQGVNKHWATPVVLVLVFTGLGTLAAPRRAAAQFVPPMYWGLDADSDGIDDGLEQYLASRFFPNVHYSRGSNGGCLGPLPFVGKDFPPIKKPVVFRAFHPVTTVGFTVPDYIVIAYVLLYDQDCGSGFPFGDYHTGDNEAFLIVVQYNEAIHDWQFVELTTNPHHKAVACEVHLVSSYHNGDRADIWPGYDKHGNYPVRNSDGCPFPWSEDDTGQSPIQDTDIRQHALYNLGEENHPFITDLGDVYNFPVNTWRGINPWKDKFFDAGYIWDDVRMDDSSYRFDYAPPPSGQVWLADPTPTCDVGALSTAQLPAAGGTGQLSFARPASCGWSVRSDADWLTITAVDSPNYPYPRSSLAGAGDGVISYSVTANTSAFGRLARLFIGGQAVLVGQDGVGCNYSLSPSSQSLGVTGGSGSAVLSVGAGNCAWSVSSDAWIAITSPPTGTGTGTVTYAVAHNDSSLTRSGSISINGAPLVAITQTGGACSYALSDTVVTFPHAPSTHTLSVWASIGDCQWSASALAAWLTVPNDPHTGNGSVQYQMAVNSHSSARAGGLSVGSVSGGPVVYVSIKQQGEPFVDFDGDGKSDLVVARPRDSLNHGGQQSSWFVNSSSTGFTSAAAYPAGLPGDVPVPGDYDGDGKVDVAVWRPSGPAFGTWYISTSSTGYTATPAYQWGIPGDIPIPGDYDGDGKTDLAVWRPSEAKWYVLFSSTGYTTSAVFAWGIVGDRPVPGDYDGDGKADVAVWRPTTATWYLLLSSTGYDPNRAVIRQWGLVGDIPAPGDYDGDGLTDLGVWRPSDGTWRRVFAATNWDVNQASATTAWGLPGDIPVPAADYDGDGMADLVVWRPSEANWYVSLSSTGYATGHSAFRQWGFAADTPLPTDDLFARTMSRPGDYNGDRKADIAVFRPSTGIWYIGGTANQFGNGADIPVPGDYDGDGIMDLAVFRPSNATWYVNQSLGAGTAAVMWGIGTDIPVPGDYDGDGITDIAVFRPDANLWSIRPSSSPVTQTVYWGSPGDIPVPGDYDGDGKTDVAVYRPSAQTGGTWYVVQSSNQAQVGFQWGAAGDIPVPGDYDGDGKTDFAVWRPSTGTFYLWLSSTQSALAIQWGGGGDIPVPADYDGDGKTDIAVFRPSTSEWFIRGIAYAVFGGAGDIPLTMGPAPKNPPQ
jgi:hypothetical protein